MVNFGNSLFYGIRAHSDHDPDKVLEKLMSSMPEIRNLLKSDIVSAFKGDPASKSYTEIIRSYPFLDAMIIHRISNVLYKEGVSAYARELSEHVHSMTGIDIHPGASIGSGFFIDHGTGVVIGETSVIGNNVRLSIDHHLDDDKVCFIILTHDSQVVLRLDVQRWHNRLTLPEGLSHIIHFVVRVIA